MESPKQAPPLSYIHRQSRWNKALLQSPKQAPISDPEAPGRAKIAPQALFYEAFREATAANYSVFLHSYIILECFAVIILFRYKTRRYVTQLAFM